MFTTKSVKGQVMKIINARIKEAQQLFEADVKSLDDSFGAQVEVLKTNLVNDKAAALEKHVNSVLSKVI